MSGKLLTPDGNSVSLVFVDGGDIPAGSSAGFKLSRGRAFHIVNDGEEAVPLKVRLERTPKGKFYNLVCWPLGAVSLQKVVEILEEIPGGTSLKYNI